MALGSCTSIQNFYEIKRERNQEILKNAELIITESNINEINHSNSIRNLSTHLIYYNLCFFYKELYFLKKKICVCILPYPHADYKIINNVHRKLCLKYGFNIIDMQSYYEKVDLVEFGEKADPSHPLPSIMKLLGRSIITSLGDFHLPKNSISSMTIPNSKFALQKI
ncbi:MAG: hypothetical protein J1E31_01550 [Helicobacter sp.]|nr:hypothetical protein [Helicobacter sp.]